MDKFEIGQVVRIKQWEDMVKEFEVDVDGDIECEATFTRDMKYLCNKCIEITGDNFEDYNRLEVDDWEISLDMCELVSEPRMKLRIKYFEGATKLEKISKGNWIDIYSNKDIFIPEGESALIPLGFALELPRGYEGHLAPRSSTFKTWGIIQTNSMGVVDDSYIGDNDEWCMPVYCLKGNRKSTVDSDSGVTLKAGTRIHKGDKIGQFRIMEVMPPLEFEEVESFGNADRGGFGTTGPTKLKE